MNYVILTLRQILLQVKIRPRYKVLWVQDNFVGILVYPNSQKSKMYAYHFIIFPSIFVLTRIRVAYMEKHYMPKQTLHSDGKNRNGNR